MANSIPSEAISVHAASSRLAEYHNLVDRYHEELYRYGYWLSKNRVEAEVLVRQTCLGAWRLRINVKEGASVRRWLFTILNREFLRVIRHYPLKRKEDEPMMTDGCSGNNQEDIERRSLQQAIMQLPLHDRQPLLLLLMGGFTINEITEILDLKLNTVLAGLIRARKKLAGVQKLP